MFISLFYSLHKILMDLQNQQLAQLADWLTKTEERTKKIDSEPLGPDLEDLKRQVEEHKVCYGIHVLHNLWSDRH